MKTLQDRSAGVLCHITSLSGSWASGDLGPEAYHFVDFLCAAGQSWWQVLPCHPTGTGDSPYQALSVFAGNPVFISLELLAQQGWLDAADLVPPGLLALEKADFAATAAFRIPRLRKAWERFQLRADKGQKKELLDFSKDHAFWLEDWARFSAAKRLQNGRHWVDWDPGFAGTLPADETDFEKFVQYLYHGQWIRLRSYAHAKGVALIGDMPIFVSHDSADVWARPELFDLDGQGRPNKVAGVPPDYFSEDGQHWGNPLYRWDRHKADGYAWWVSRFRRAIEMFDAMRVDHFIGFHREWQIPASSPTARDGAYAPGPGMDFLRALEGAFPHMPIIAEDLGVVTPEVTALRKSFKIPGMRVIQFSFGSGEELLPEHFEEDCVVYTGTHDNDTTLGWLSEAPPSWAGREQAAAFRAERTRAERWAAGLGSGEDGKVWPLIAATLGTASRTAIVPLQDLLELGAEARMNRPGTAEGNWGWRNLPATLTSALALRLASLTRRFGRA